MDYIIQVLASRGPLLTIGCSLYVPIYYLIYFVVNAPTPPPLALSYQNFPNRLLASLRLAASLDCANLPFPPSAIFTIPDSYFFPFDDVASIALGFRLRQPTW